MSKYNIPQYSSSHSRLCPAQGSRQILAWLLLSRRRSLSQPPVAKKSTTAATRQTTRPSTTRPRHRHNSCGDASELQATGATCHCEQTMLRSHPGTHLPPAARGRLHDPLPRPFNEPPDRLHASRVAPTLPGPARRRRQFPRRLQPHLRAAAGHQHRPQ